MPARKARLPTALVAVSAAVAATLALPLVFLLIEAHGAGTAEVTQLIFRRLTADLLWNTVRLTVVVTIGCAVIGTAAAWCVERTDLPGRRVWAVLVVVPLAIPDFVVSFGWASLWTWVHGFRGAVVVMTLAVYPLVYLPVAASLRAADPGQEEVARSLGVGRAAHVRAGSPWARPAARSWAAACWWPWCCWPSTARSRSSATRRSPPRSSPSSRCRSACPPRARSRWSWSRSACWFWPARGCSAAGAGWPGPARWPSAGCRRSGWAGPRCRCWPASAMLTALALGVPAGSSVWWMFEGGAHAIAGVSLVSAALHTAGYGVCAGALATVAALPIALLAVRYPGRVRHLLERSTYLVLAMPGVVTAFALSYFSERYGSGLLYQSALLLVICYSIMFFPLALVGVKASLARAPASLDEVARSLGQRRLAVLSRVTLRLAGPGLAAAFCLVFLSVVTELTATLLLIPTGVQTLATQFWAYETNLSYGQAAPFALVMIAVAAVPSYVLRQVL